MTPKIQTILAAELLPTARRMREQGFRLVQINATRLPETLELTYSFDLNCQFENFRIQLPPEGAAVPSISSVYWCAFLYENEMHDLYNLNVEGMAVDFHGNLYRTSVKYAFGNTKAPLAPAAAAQSAPKPVPAAAGA